MNIIIISNIITPHQIPLCDEFTSMTEVEVSFIETMNVDKNTLPIGWKSTCTRDYVISYEYYSHHTNAIQEKILTADVVIIGSAPKHLIQQRLERKLLTFIYSERIYKNYKDILKWPFHALKYRHIYARYSSLHLLCASAYASKDYRKVGCFKDKAFKWGYFTKVDEGYEVEASKLNASTSEITPIMWCARFLRLKHPELPVQMAARLKAKGYKFTLDMYGSGVELDNTKKLIDELGVGDIVTLCGNLPNEEILQQMRQHEIFLFTSDRNEGWGAVANEAMSNGCVLVGSSAIGSVPFLIEDGVNGCVFESGKADSLTETVEWLLNNPVERKQLAINGYNTLCKVWSPMNAARNFISLVRCLQVGKGSSITQGPCSNASLLDNNWYKKNCRL